MAEETVTITRAEYEEMLSELRFLDALYAAGVDNWEGYGFAQERFAEGE